MAVSLQKVSKGQKVSLEKSVKNALIGIGWTNDLDLDVSVFCVGGNGLCSNEKDFVFYGNLIHPSGSIIHSPDDTGDGDDGDDDGDREQVVVVFNKVPAYVEKIVVVATIYDVGPTFGQVKGGYVRVAKIGDRDVAAFQNGETLDGETVIEYDLEEEFSSETAVVAAEIYRDGSEWKFGAVGQGFEGGLAAMCANYGIDAE